MSSVSQLLHSHSPFRIFAVSSLITIGSLIAVYYYFGWQALFLAAVLIVIEVTFSFDNAIINARVLNTMSRFWQQMFMTIGILIAVFGMRLVFPIVVVMLTAGLGWNEVINLALNNPQEYSRELEEAHPTISSFGGMFLLMLALHFFFDKSRDIKWISVIEAPLMRIGKWWLHSAISLIILVILTLLPFNQHPQEIFIAGLLGILTYLGVHGLAELFANKQETNEKKKIVAKTGLAGFTAFLYLEVLDASFSFDSVIGAFAVTNDVVLIAIGLGIGAFWVRSLTLFMVRRKTLHAYRFLEHGAHYTILILAFVLLASLFKHIPEAFAGILGIGIIGASIYTSVKAKQAAELEAK